MPSRNPELTDTLVAAQALRLDLSEVRVDDDEGLRRAAATLTSEMSEALGVARVGIWFLSEDRRRLTIYHLHERGNAASFEGALLGVEGLHGYVEALMGRLALRIDDVSEDTRVAELRDAYLEPLGITSMLDVPLLRDGEVIGVLCCEHVGPPRAWTDEEAALAVAGADAFALKLAEAAHGTAEGALAAARAGRPELRDMALLGQMAAGIAHDLNNILTIVSGNAELLGDPGLPPDEVSSIVDEIRASAARGKDLALELMELGRKRPSAPRLISIGEHLRPFVVTLDRGLGRNHRVRYEASGVGRALIDQRQLERVLMNLAINGRDAMPQGGELTIRVGDADLPEGEGHGSWISIEIIDHGRGMDETTSRRLFDPFFSTKPDGKGGLGMTIVKDLVSRAGGFMAVDSAPGRGTNIRVYLPRVA